MVLCLLLTIVLPILDFSLLILFLYVKFLTLGLHSNSLLSIFLMVFGGMERNNSKTSAGEVFNCGKCRVLVELCRSFSGCCRRAGGRKITFWFYSSQVAEGWRGEFRCLAKSELRVRDP